VNAEFNWWLLIVGLVIGAGLVWLILADGSRRDADVTARERAAEARWIAEELRRSGRRLDDHVVADVLDLHALYLSAPPPDEPDDEMESAVTGADAPWRIGERFERAARTEHPSSTNTVTTDASRDPFRADSPAGEPEGTPADWPGALRTASDRPRSDGRDQPSPTRTG
jgi:hypothetical protein